MTDAKIATPVGYKATSKRDKLPTPKHRSTADPPCGSTDANRGAGRGHTD
jgi:hypothetical protein